MIDPEPFVSMFQTAWSGELQNADRYPVPRYIIISMSGWSYNGPQDTERLFELELRCSVTEHKRVRDFYVENNLQGARNWPRIIGTARGGLMQTNRDPQGLCLCFESAELREKFKEYWPCES